ncbi:response regulator of citrate/malate metabolism [Actinokineospora baliensis]|uniref:response regulator n=1 Tax=Actinokineospora baliensis TaxID=547056 RepID=UPI001956D187|nr:response regulator [Actinokineospora baliensis]MBM7770720.1 response regulator of citrate/malate metabolism [Actinokineospora baliensis]
MISVLVVDDDFMVAKVHSGYIERTPGFTVAGVAHTGAQALALAARLQPDLVLLDIYLPDTGGLEVLRELRNGPTDPDVIVISAATDIDTLRTAQRGGALHYLIKPFAYAALHDQLRHFAALHTRLNELTTATQAAADEVFGARPRSALPKGLTPQTATLVTTVLNSTTPDISAAECAAATHLSRVSARRYLEHFVATGQAQVHLRYGTTGRPERRYRPS